MREAYQYGRTPWQKKILMNGKIVVVDGPISAGKTTLVKNGKIYFDSVFVELSSSSDFEKLQAYCKNPDDCCYVFENFLIEKRIKTYDQAIDLANSGKNVLLDRSIFSSLYFLDLNYIHEKKLLKKDYEELKTKINDYINDKRKPDKIIVLDSKPETCFERIKLRNGSNLDLKCENYYTESYLKNLDMCIKDWVPEMKKNVEVEVRDWENFDKGFSKSDYQQLFF